MKKGPNAGKVYKNQRKLFVAKETTLKTLQKLASKPERNGLAGCTFDVSRGPENTNPPGVGSTFDFVMKHKSLAAIAEKYELKVEDMQPIKYDSEEEALSSFRLKSWSPWASAKSTAAWATKKG